MNPNRMTMSPYQGQDKYVTATQLLGAIKQSLISFFLKGKHRP